MRIASTTMLRLTTLGLLIAMAAPASAQAQSYGTIKGKVVWGGAQVPELPPKVKQGENVKDAQVCAAEPIPDESLVIDPRSKGVKYCLVYLVRPKGSNPELVNTLVEEHPQVVIDQQGCKFVPHLVALHEKQQALFKSSDPVAHNVRLQGFSNSLNFMLPANGELPRPLSSERRPMPMACDIHPWMQGYIMVFDHPFFAVTDEEGNFEIPGVPAGEQNVVIWHEKVGYVTPGLARGQAVEVQAGKETSLGEVTLDPSKVR
ncbi:carboxypeptidase regulatory-like domain-containing protein [Tautonia sociabilis]|uniref:Methylamine utilization protein n=1 Tax=Tautonia sociabilis TaxID=2080755 RepID=A0A432MM04_9BACT|nr:carboxypeptidase regulatory-like domain-containing protein [Tautonia sociabilis]RUL88441.1 hypothetical protein TsocGM_06925 [Tautonia sociabilis]